MYRVSSDYARHSSHQYLETRKVMGKLYLVKEDILPISALSGKVFQIAISADAMLLAELLPKLTPNCNIVISGGCNQRGDMLCKSAGLDAHRCCRIAPPGW